MEKTGYKINKKPTTRMQQINNTFVLNGGNGLMLVMIIEVTIIKISLDGYAKGRGEDIFLGLT